MGTSGGRGVVPLARLVTLALVALVVGLQPGCKSKDSSTAGRGPGAGGASRPSGPPGLVLSRHFIDVGVLGPQATHEELVALQNAGGEELAIKEAKIACTCFRASFDQKKIEPGGSAGMKVAFLTLGHRGEVSEVIGIVSNDPEGVKVLTLRFEVPQDLATVPDRLWLGVVRPGQRLSMPVKVVANVDLSTKVLYAISNSERLIGRVVDPALSRSKPARLEVEATAPDVPGTYRYDLNVTTAHEKMPTVRLPVVLSVAATASVEPGQVEFGRFVRGDRVSRQVVVKLAEGTRLKAAMARPEVLEIETVAAEAGGQAHLRLAPAGKVNYGPFRGEIRLQLEGKEDCEILVPFSGYVADRPEP